MLKRTPEAAKRAPQDYEKTDLLIKKLRKFLC